MTQRGELLRISYSKTLKRLSTSTNHIILMCRETDGLPVIDYNFYAHSLMEGYYEVKAIMHSVASFNKL